jgi:Fe-S-cluster containining protein
MSAVDAQASGARREVFGYVCRRCLKCCHHKRIQLNPYEVARLARSRSVTTAEFTEAWTENGEGRYLRQTETGACVFLGSAGCMVHPDRPLVCRLYPLGRHVQQDGSESFSHLEPHPQSRGELTNTGTIAGFLEAQDAGPFMRAADEYFFWLSRAREHLGDAETGATDASEEGAEMAHDLLDMDAAVARHCAAAAISEPADMEERKRLHLIILYQQLEDNLGGRHE